MRWGDLTPLSVVVVAACHIAASYEETYKTLSAKPARSVFATSQLSQQTRPFPILCIYAFSAKSKTTSTKYENLDTNLFFLFPSPFCGAILQKMHINRRTETWLKTNVHFYSKRLQRRWGFICFSAKVMYAHLGYQRHVWRLQEDGALNTMQVNTLWIS